MEPRSKSIKLLSLLSKLDDHRDSLDRAIDIGNAELARRELKHIEDIAREIDLQRLEDQSVGQAETFRK